MNLELDFSLNKSDNLLRKFEEIHNFIYANDGLSTGQTLEEFTKVLFIKILDEKEKSNNFRIDSNELHSIQDPKNGNDFISRINFLFDRTKLVFSDLFDKNDKIQLSINSLSFIVNKLQNISLSDSSSDAKGLAFQKFISHHEKDGRGQFFTPEQIIKFCVSIIQPQAEEKIIDPACGSGGFLFSSLQYIKSEKPNIDISNLIKNNIYGLDINKNISRISKMKLILEANVPSNIYNINSLIDIDELKLKFNNIEDGFDIVLTNPPFGTAGKISDKYLLSRFDMGHKWTKNGNDMVITDKLQNSQVAEILFVERCIDLLKEGGRMGIVLPNGHFENPSLEYLRNYIKQRCKILALINLPDDAFIPYGTGVKTSLLFAEKQSQIRDKKYYIFFSRIKKLGYLGNKNGSPIYKKDNYGRILFNKNGHPQIDEDYSLVINDYRNFCNNEFVETDNSYTINNHELKSRFDYNFYSPENVRLVNVIIKNNAKKLSDLVDIVKIRSKKLSEQNRKVEYIELSDINTASFEIINSTELFVYDLPSRASFEIKTGDIIVAIAGNSIGSRKHAIALVNERYNGAICTNGFRILRNFKIDPYYLLFFLKSQYFLKQIHRLRTGAAIPNVSDVDFGKILISIPDSRTLNMIGNSVRKSFELREKSNKELESISFDLI